MLYLCCTNFLYLYAANQPFMTSVKIVLRQKNGKDNTFPLAIRITKDRKTSFIHVGNIKESDWNADSQRVRKSHPNSARLNNYLVTKLAEATDKALTLETEKEYVSARAVKQKIKPTGGATFFSQAKIYLDDLFKAGNYNVYNADKPRVNRFREFLNGGDIAFSDITVTLLKKFILFLQTYHTLKPDQKTKSGKPTKPKKPIAYRTISNYLIVIRTIINDAREAKIYDGKNYPFGGKEGISINLEGGLKIGLTADEVVTLEQLDLADSPKEDHARNVWLVSFYFAGARHGDTLILMRNDFQNGRLYYSMNKNHKGDSLKVSEKAIAIVERYMAMNHNHGLLFPELAGLVDLNNKYEVQRMTALADKNLNTYLKRVALKAKIEKKLTMHISRHTFGNIAGDKIPLPMLQKLYRHSKITTTAIYQQNFIHKATDEALEAVLGKVVSKDPSMAL